MRTFAEPCVLGSVTGPHEVQDYYEWRGARPEGGSIMIVGSTDSASPTGADHWLLKRTWKEMKELRGW